MISPQYWGTMHISKHHYAIELSKLGHNVYFLEPASPEVAKIEVQLISANLHLIKHKKPWFYKLKFHSFFIYKILVATQIKALLQLLPEIDLVWSFDLGNTFPLVCWPKTSFKIFHPVDEPRSKLSLIAHKGCDMIISVTDEILSKYKFDQEKKVFINHGISDAFLEIDYWNEMKVGSQIRFGLSGNWLRNDLDRATLLEIFKQFKDCIFECWGTYTIESNNLGGEFHEDQVKFIAELLSLPNVIMHGAVKPEILAKEYQRMNGFIICYDVNKDQSKGTNYHKVLEFLITGKPVISNNITTYENKYPGILHMVKSRNSNNEMLMLIKEVVESDLIYINNKAQIDFAKQFTYCYNAKSILNLTKSV